MNHGDQTLAQARAFDQQGRLAEAIEGYRRFLASEPRNGAALQLLGIALARVGRPTEAAEALSAAAAIQPANPVLQANLGRALSESGRDSEALACYGRAVALKPDFAAGHHGRGMTLLRLGQPEAAVKSLNDAVRLQPDHAGLHNDLGLALERVDRKTDALAHFERATRLDPSHVQAHYNRGVLEGTLGRHSQALDTLDRALALQPRHAAIHASRGNVLADLGRTEEAIASFDRALALQPRDPVTLRSRGELLLRLDRLTEAVASLEAALTLTPQDFDSHFHRGVALARLERATESLASFDHALALNSASAQVLNNRGVVLSQLNRLEDAFQSFSRATAIDPEHVDAYANAGDALRSLNRYPEALQCFDRALALQPRDSKLLWGKALVLLTLGEFAQGWPLYESRLQLAHLRPLQRHSDLPRWTGDEPIDGKTLLVHAEQGLGDTVQFCRYLPLLESKGARVIFEVQPALKKLLRTLPMRGEIFAFEETLPGFDLRTPLLSLPLIFGTGRDSIPGGVPYLSVDPARAAAWQERLAALPGLKVGITWQGNLAAEKQGGFQGRSFGLAAAAPLARVPGVTLISLQKGPGSEQRAQVEFSREVLELTSAWEMGAEELADTAALMKELDLIVTADTATAHLAGALGLRVWVLLSASPDWRWLTDRDDSPWYPTMRLFRQRQAGDWAEVFQRVAIELAELSARAIPST